MCEDFAACHWVRLSETLLCAAEDCWSARQVLLNRAYCRDRCDARRGGKRTREEEPEESNCEASEKEVKDAENGAKDSEREVKDAENGAKDSEKVKDAENGAKDSEKEVEDAEVEVTVKDAENGVGVSGNEAESLENEVKNFEKEVKDSEKEVKVVENEVSTSEKEIRVVTSGKKAKVVKHAVKSSLKAVDVIENEVQTTLKELKDIENQVESLNIEESSENEATASAANEVKRLATKVKALENQCKASENKVKLLEGKVKALESQVKVAEPSNKANHLAMEVKDAGEADNEAETEERAIFLGAGDAQLSLSSGEEEAALMRALGLPTAFGRPAESSGDLSDDEAPSTGGRGRARQRKRTHRTAAGQQQRQQLEAGDKALRRRFEKFWREEGAALKYAAFVQTYGRLLGVDFWRSVPASAARDPYVAQLMAEADAEADGDAEADDADAEEFEWEAAWPEFVMQLRQRWFLWFLHENRDPGEARSPGEKWKDQLVALGCACNLQQSGALQPLVLHAKTNRVAVSHSRLTSAKEERKEVEDEEEEEVPEGSEGAGPELRKYWSQRYRLFSRWDEGVQLDRESWFSVTPEKIAQHQAQRLSNATVIVDAFCGAGGNTIQFAHYCDTVIAVDIDPSKLAMAAHNAAVYGVADRVHFVCGDFFRIVPALRLDPHSTALFLSPPWGGPAYLQRDVFDLSDLGGFDCAAVLATARRLTPNVAFFAPRNANVAQLVSAANAGEMVEIEQNFLNNKLKAITAYFGDLVDDVTASY